MCSVPAKTGSQAVFVDGSTASQSGPYHADFSAGPIIDLSADIAIFSAGTQSEWQFAGLGSGLAPFLGGIDILPDNRIIAITSGFPVIGLLPRATTFDATAWHYLDLQFNIPALTYSIMLDGGMLDSNVPFCGDNGPCAGGAVSSYGDGIFDSFGGASDSGYMDNYRVANVTATPEPMLLPLLVGLVGLCIGLRWKLSSAELTPGTSQE